MNGGLRSTNQPLSRSSGIKVFASRINFSPDHSPGQNHPIGDWVVNPSQKVRPLGNYLFVVVIRLQYRLPD
jgi:hypothetical protein